MTIHPANNSGVYILKQNFKNRNAMTRTASFLLLVVGTSLNVAWGYPGKTPGDSVSSSFRFASKYLPVLNSKMHYVELGKGDPILLLHGNPSSVYIWRNNIKELSKKGRVIAVDLIGMGKSGKPDIEYGFKDHAKYLNAFIDKMGLKNITLIMHDWGTSLGFYYAMLNPSKVKAFVFFEALLTPLPPLSQWPEAPRKAFEVYRSDKGWDAIVNENKFIENRLQEGIIRKLSETEMSHYREPYLNKKDRKPLWKWPNELPIDGKPEQVYKIQMDYLKYLTSSPVPKLFLYASPGVLNPKATVDWAEKNLPNLKTFLLGKGLHNLQEDLPLEINNAVTEWLTELEEKEKYGNTKAELRNIATIKFFYENLGEKNDWDKAWSVFHPSARFYQAGEKDTLDLNTQIQASKEFMGLFRNTKITIISIIAQGDKVMAFTMNRSTYVGKDGKENKQGEIMAADCFTFNKEGKIINNLILMDMATMRKQLAATSPDNKATIREIFRYYNQFDSAMLNYMAANANFEDPTMGLKWNTRPPAIEALIQSKQMIQNWKSEIQEIIQISPSVFDIHGTNSGIINGKPFSTLFSTALVFNKEGKVRSWIDNVNPATFTESPKPVSKKNERFIQEFMNAYATLDTAWLLQNLHPNAILIDPTFNLRLKGMEQIKKGWADGIGAYKNINRKISGLYFIADDVIDINGELHAFDIKNNKTINPPFSIIIYLKEGKIFRWTEHWDASKW
jgi:haloalkane dehalogenase